MLILCVLEGIISFLDKTREKLRQWEVGIITDKLSACAKVMLMADDLKKHTQEKAVVLKELMNKALGEE